jgi:hypothetical protein
MRVRRPPPSTCQRIHGRPSPGVCHQLVCETALADARLASEEKQAPAARENIIETADQLAQLGAAADNGELRVLRWAPGQRWLVLGRPVEFRVLSEYR